MGFRGTVGDIDAVLTTLMNSGVEPNLRVWTSILHAHASRISAAKPASASGRGRPQQHGSAGARGGDVADMAALAQSGRPGDAAMQIVRTVAASGAATDGLYAAAINVCMRAGDVAQALDVYAELRRSGLAVTPLSLATLIHGIVRTNSPHKHK